MQEAQAQLESYEAKTSNLKSAHSSEDIKQQIEKLQLKEHTLKSKIQGQLDKFDQLKVQIEINEQNFRKFETQYDEMVQRAQKISQEIESKQSSPAFQQLALIEQQIRDVEAKSQQMYKQVDILKSKLKSLANNTFEMRNKREELIKQEIVASNDLKSAGIAKSKLHHENKWLQTNAYDNLLSQFNSEPTHVILLFNT